MRLPVCVCVVLCARHRLPQADGGGREHHSVNVPVPVAARLRAHPACLPPALLGRSGALPYGAPL